MRRRYPPSVHTRSERKSGTYPHDPHPYDDDGLGEERRRKKNVYLRRTVRRSGRAAFEIATVAAIGLMLAGALSFAVASNAQQPAVIPDRVDIAFQPIGRYDGATGSAGPLSDRTAGATAGNQSKARRPADRSAPAPFTRPPVRTPTAAPHETGGSVAPASPPTKSAATSHSLRGLASWYCRAGRSVCHHSYPDGPGVDLYAAACGKLRRAMGGGWRGDVVTVHALDTGRTVRVRLIDWCGSTTKTIDLYWDAMHALGGSGVLRVTVRW